MTVKERIAALNADMHPLGRHLINCCVSKGGIEALKQLEEMYVKSMYLHIAYMLICSNDLDHFLQLLETPVSFRETLMALPSIQKMECEELDMALETV